jgi:hypothetical protein
MDSVGELGGGEGGGEVHVGVVQGKVPSDLDV